MLYTWNLYNTVNHLYLVVKKETNRPFPKMIVSFSNQYSMKVSVILHSLQHLLLLIFSFLNFSRYVGNVFWFQFAFPWWLLMLSSFACMCRLVTHSDISPTLKYGLFPLFIHKLEVTFTYPACWFFVKYMFMSILFLSGLPIHFIISVFWWAKVLILLIFHLSVFLLYDYYFLRFAQENFPCSKVTNIFCFIFISFTVLDFILETVIHFKWFLLSIIYLK